MRIVFGISAMAMAVCGSGLAGAHTNVDGPLPIADKITPVEARVSNDFHVRADLLTTSARLDPFSASDGQLQHRFASSMIDYYPFGGESGFRVSAGMRFFSVANFRKDAERATGGLLYTPRLPGGGIGGVRTGFNRHTPAATIGYASTIKNAVFGVEVGSLIGGANYDLPKSFSIASNRRGGGLNPIANIVFGLRF